MIFLAPKVVKQEYIDLLNPWLKRHQHPDRTQETFESRLKRGVDSHIRTDVQHYVFGLFCRSPDFSKDIAVIDQVFSELLLVLEDADVQEHQDLCLDLQGAGGNDGYIHKFREVEQGLVVVNHIQIDHVL